MVTVLGSVLTGFVSAWASSYIVVAKLSVHVDHHAERLKAHEEQIMRIHQRIDEDNACRYTPGRGNGAARN